MGTMILNIGTLGLRCLKHRCRCEINMRVENWFRLTVVSFEICLWLGEAIYQHRLV